MIGHIDKRDMKCYTTWLWYQTLKNGVPIDVNERRHCGNGLELDSDVKRSPWKVGSVGNTPPAFSLVRVPAAHRSWALYLLSLWNISDAGNINIPLPLATLARSDHIAQRAALFIRLAALFSVCSCKGFLTILHYKVHIRHQRFSRFNHINRKKCYNNGGGGVVFFTNCRFFARIGTWE